MGYVEFLWYVICGICWCKTIKYISKNNLYKAGIPGTLNGLVCANIVFNTNNSQLANEKLKFNTMNDTFETTNPVIRPFITSVTNNEDKITINYSSLGLIGVTTINHPSANVNNIIYNGATM